MTLIKVLSENVASQIAAGEVVERPVSVVKELVENALDAGAHNIQINVVGSGKSLIEVMDDGSGIPSVELPLAFTRHATSKISTADDLFMISTLGFRGEALASISSVSKVTLTSKYQNERNGLKINVSAGRNIHSEPVASPNGTIVRVEDLFFNVPARLKFLKSDQTERQQIDSFVSRYALAYPDTRFVYRVDDKELIHTSGSGNRKEILISLYGIDVGRQMLEVAFKEDGISINGFISPLSLTRSNRKEITFFVNGRWIHDLSLSTALLQAYHNFIMVGRYPMAMLFITIPSSDVDVNVHPAKSEVRFRKSDEMFSRIQRAVRRTLLAYSPIPQMTSSEWQITPVSAFNPMLPINDIGGSSGSNSDVSFNSISSDSHEIFSVLPLLRLIGQAGLSYLIAEGPDGLYLIDQHAAHERVLFEKMMKQRDKQIDSQNLLEPVLVQIPPASKTLLERQFNLLNHYGFEIESFGNDVFRIRAIPSLLMGMDPSSALQVLIEDFEEDETPLGDEIEARIIARVCKRAAVKGGKVLSPEEQRALISDLEACETPRTCPHGRPTMIHLSVDLLEKQFGRRGAR